MAGLRRKAGQLGLHRAEAEIARTGFVADVVVVLAQLKPSLVVVRPFDERHVIRHDGATVVRAAAITRPQPAARADAAALEVRATEGERREVRAWHVLQTDLRRPIL